jgi:hypothetical protein
MVAWVMVGVVLSKEKANRGVRTRTFDQHVTLIRRSS